MNECGQCLYQEIHRFRNQKNVIDGIPIDPIQRDYFDMADNEERPQLEINDWWDKPYITTQGWDGETYDEHIARSKIDNFTPIANSREEYEAQLNEREKRWFEVWPTGIRYNVRCLDGGAWDRSTNRGAFATLEEAIAIATNLHFSLQLH